MFTGIINHIGRFKGYRLKKQEVIIEAPSVCSLLEIGDSLAVNGVCLSLIKKDRNHLHFNLSDETLQRTNLGSLRSGQKLNLELPLALSSLVSGHLVTGHIDESGKVLQILKKKSGLRMEVSLPPSIKPYFIEKGSVTLNGVSLTIAKLSSTSFEVELIPITLEKSNLGDLKRGDTVNIESDMIGKYLYNWTSKHIS